MKNTNFTIYIILLFIILICVPAICQENSVGLKDIRYHSYSNKLRVVFDLTGPVEYSVATSEGYLNLYLYDVLASSKIENIKEIEDLLVHHLIIQKVDNDIIIRFNLAYPIKHNIFFIPHAPRLVIDFSRNFTAITKFDNIQDGIDLSYITHGSQSGFSKGYVLKIDPNNAEIVPALAPANPNLIQRFVDIFNPFTGAPRFSFSRNTVSNIVKEYKAIAGINGMFYSPSGYPYGILMINYELMSSPIYERTALAITEDNEYFIDNFSSNDYFYLPSNVKVPIKAINEPIIGDGVILYTSRWGRRTGTKKSHVDIVIKEHRVVNIILGNAEIPVNGYVLSASGPALEFLGTNIKIGDKIDLSLNLIPHSYSDSKMIKNLIGGGPRLVKSGNIYVSKYEEKFRYDVARGRAARSAVGITKDGKILLVCVDGRKRGRIKKLRSSQKESIGMTLEELSRLMIYLNAIEAVNLDGGSSSTMVVEKKLINSPTAGSEKSVANALIVKPK